ncbi:MULTISPECIES: PDR/VanB family oxidoreductase [unclassified Microbacterium]|uniref:PDR/VanB family oxidoreductase n=1 Tax=unclassified Microbacterium TaxID=2609290 RepID=UPI00214C99B5|nr:MULTISPECIES: PDR/VanB family oxidoreductase [unclassified Microbacterium]MCR2808504.1 PDR/VanB family oxidoreductase [Microbacterium sp. zg.B185]WIM19056.1 PDR/VanB family oxidoreductase [Microbacterium sp. zg-B185]
MVDTLATASARRNAAHGGTLVVTGRRDVAQDVVELTLARPGRERLPDWAPGAHIDIVLPDGTTRQYSLLGDRWDAHSFTIAVLREPVGRGGSEHIHAQLSVGDTVGFGGPRNNFRLSPAPGYLFIAGGIGITPLMPMIRQAELLGDPWRLLYLGRSRARLAYLDELAGYGERVTVHTADERGRAVIDDWMPDPAVAPLVYACGPERLLDAVDRWAAPLGRHRVRLERFTARGDVDRPTTAFDVEVASSGAVVTVQKDESIVDALRRIDVDVITSCAQGVCGTCETGVLAGVPDHRDSLLNEAERAESRCLYPCISRAVSDRLVLDL